MAVFFVCKQCAEEHKAPITFMNKAAFESSKFRYDIFKCSKTGKTASYDKLDLIWKEDKPWRQKA